MDHLILNVLKWGSDRGLHNTDDLRGQLTKLTEELGEIAAGVARDDQYKIIDGVGDLLVVLINFGAVFDRRYFPEDQAAEKFLEGCLFRAWNEIKARTGKTHNGIFVKDEPPSEEEN